MNQERNQLFKEFEKEVWLYLDKDLPESRIRFWNSKLKDIPELERYIEDYIMISNAYEKATQFNMPEQKLNLIIAKAISKDSLWNKFKTTAKKMFSNETEFVFGKVAFASVLIIVAIIISLLSNKSSPVIKITETVNSEILDWNGSFVENQIYKVGNLLKLAKDDDYKKYYLYKIRSDNWDKDIYLIDNNINELKKELTSSNL